MRKKSILACILGALIVTALVIIVFVFFYNSSVESEVELETNTNVEEKTNSKSNVYYSVPPNYVYLGGENRQIQMDTSLELSDYKKGVINSLVFEKEYMPVPTGYQFPEGEEALSFRWKKLDGEGQTNFEPYLGCEYAYYENQWYLFYNNKWCLLLTDREMRTKRWIDGEWKLDD